ncbi:MAG: hypothetical protein MMC23_001520 [Stictis urceolatum]|nr:hypothetical protein [Stictis urceolata]
MGNLIPPADYTSTENLFQSYDFIIVGGGQAGLVLASRLTQRPELSVLVLEAGSSNHNDPMILAPAYAQKLQKNDQYDWDFYSEPQVLQYLRFSELPIANVFQTAYGGRQISQTRGKGLGGSSAINMNMAVMPSKPSLDAWEQLGNPGWGFESLSPYLTKFQTLREPPPEAQQELGLDYLQKDQLGRGSGPIQLSYGRNHSKLNKAWTATFDKLGYKCKTDPITGLHYGAYNTPVSVDPSTESRSYAANAYLNDRVTSRPNLRIITEARVEAVLLEEAGNAEKVATGIRFVAKTGKRKSVRSTETILSAGVFQSPQLLELSGIGNPSILNTNGIEPFVNLPGVGENLQDHPIVGVSFESNEPTLDSLRDPETLNAAVSEYQSSKSGPLASSPYNVAYMPCMALLDSDSPSDLTSLLDKHTRTPTSPPQKRQQALLQPTILDPSRSSIEYMALPFQLTPEISPAASSLSPAAKAADYITLFAALSHPFSRGTVHISSPSPTAPPSIDPCYFSHPLDLELEARHLSWLETLVKTEPLASMLKPNGRRIPEGIDLGDLAQARGCLRNGFTTYHPCGTCAMMPRVMGGVVDERLRVYGVRGLRVVDASVFPLIPRGNIMSVVYAVAERAADLIKEEWDVRRSRAEGS